MKLIELSYPVSRRALYMKKKQWFAPVNSKKVGEPVDINSTRPWTAMPLNLNPLENLLYG